MNDSFTILTDFAEGRDELVTTASRFAKSIVITETVELESLHAAKVVSMDVMRDVDRALSMGAHVEAADGEKDIVVVGKDKKHLEEVLGEMGYPSIGAYADGGHPVVETRIARLSVREEVNCFRKGHRVGRFPLSLNKAG